MNLLSALQMTKTKIIARGHPVRTAQDALPYYSQLLEYLHKASPQERIASAHRVLLDCNDFIALAGDDSQSADLRLLALEAGVHASYKVLGRHAGLEDQNLAMCFALYAYDGPMPPTMVSFMQTKARQIETQLQQLLGIAKDPEAGFQIRSAAIRSFDMVARVSSETFRIPLQRDTYDDDFVLIAETAQDTRLTHVALSIGAVERRFPG